jgi:hypothetical protein
MFPDELLVKIFDQLNLNTRIKLLYVSDRFKEITQVLEYNHQVKLIRYRDVKFKLTNVKIINVDDDDYRWTSISKKEWDYLSGSTHLKKLNLRQCSFSGNLLEKLIGLSNLQKLVLRTFSGKYGLQCLSRLTTLEKLIIHHKYVWNPQYKLNELRSLINLKVFEYHNGIVYNDDLNFLKELIKLKRLALINCKIVDSNGLNNIKDLNLKELIIKYSSNDKLDFVKDLTNLKKLTLKGGKFDGSQLIHLRNLTGLTHLNLHDCANITDDSMNYISQLNNLKKLNIIGCDKMTYYGLTILSEMPNIKDLCSDCISLDKKQYLEKIFKSKTVILRTYF